MAEVHPGAEIFGEVADLYERGRPGYPAGAVDRIVNAFGLGPESVVVEVGAGTGKFTRLLAPRVARLIAVEPAAGMRARLRTTVPEIEVIDGSAEALPIADGSVDALVAAQVWHWVDGDRALPEAARVLRSGGIGLVWNRWDESTALLAELTALVDAHRTTTPTHRTGKWRAPFERTDLFHALETTEVPHAQPTDRETLIARVTSISVIAELSAPQRAEVAAAVGEAFDRHAGGAATIDVPYVTEVHTASLV